MGIQTAVIDQCCNGGTEKVKLPEIWKNSVRVIMETNKVAHQNEASKPTQERIHRSNVKFLADRYQNYKRSYDEDRKSERGRMWHFVPKGQLPQLKGDEVLDMEAYLKDFELEMDVKEYEKNSSN